MRWDSLFADLEAQFDAEARLAFESDVVDLSRAEIAGLRLIDRLRAHVSRELRFSLIDGTTLAGRPGEVGLDWVLFDARPAATLVPLAAITGVTGLSRAADSPTRSGLRLGLETVLRGLAQDRSPVTVWTIGGSPATGTIDRVGADHIDLAVHPLDAPRRVGAVSEVRSLPLGALVRVTATP